MKIARAVVVRPTYRPQELALRASSNPSVNIRKAIASAGFTVGDEVTIILTEDYERMAGLADATARVMARSKIKAVRDVAAQHLDAYGEIKGPQCEVCEELAPRLCWKHRLEADDAIKGEPV